MGPLSLPYTHTHTGVNAPAVNTHFLFAKNKKKFAKKSCAAARCVREREKETITRERENFTVRK